MAQVQDYISGNILTMIKKGFHNFGKFRVPILGKMVKSYMSLELKKFAPIMVTADKVRELIQNSDRCAVGQRVCNSLFDGADHGESVFLDELADGLVQAGKASYVDKEHAIHAIIDNRHGPIIISRVSGKHTEICRSIAKNCIYWNSEKHGLKCIQREAKKKPA